MGENDLYPDTGQATTLFDRTKQGGTGWAFNQGVIVHWLADFGPHHAWDRLDEPYLGHPYLISDGITQEWRCENRTVP